MVEPVYKYKVIIGKKENIFSKTIDKPKYFNNLKEIREHILKRKQELGEKLWFYKVWEFGKEDYINMKKPLKDSLEKE